jgi:hypothetical protein
VALYDVLADGYHTPLSETQIAKLFQAGCLGRNQPCKKVEKKEWRTIDELFPLLKYDSSGQFFSASARPHNSRTFDRILAVVVAVVVILAGTVAFYFYSHSETRGPKDAAILEATVQPSTRRDDNTAENIARANTTKPAPLAQSDTSSQRARLAQERLTAQRQLEQVQAAKLAQDRTEAARRELAQQKAVGRNEVVPLDRDTFIPDVGGSGMTVRIHDNDVTSFDVWINGGSRRQVIKQKGNTGSRTDETLIYQNGRARLYYVWEISGKLNSCLLRVRDE